MHTGRFKLVSALLLFAVVSLAVVSRADAQGRTFIRDAEIEHIIRVYATPVLQAAGLSPQSIDIYLIDDPTLNAFVIPGGRMFLHTGLLMRAEDPLQVIGVIAHETGHITGGHTIGRGEELRNASYKSIAATLLSIGAGVLSGDGRAATTLSSAGQDVALKGLLAYTRSQESAADQAAVNYLRGTEQSPRGLLEFMEILEDQEALLSSSQDPYLRTHPLTRQRVTFIRQALQESPYADQPAPPELVEMHARMQAKLAGFLRPQELSQRYPPNDQSLPARYARAIALFRSGRIDQGLTIIDSLLTERPQDPYFHELRGQMLLESGRVREALPSYETAVALLPEEPQLRESLVHTQLELNSPQYDQAALENITYVLARDPDNGKAWRQAAIAYGRLGDTGMTAMSLAEMHFSRGNWTEARGQAKRAQQLLPQASPAWLRATDLEQVAERRIERQRQRE